MSDDSKALLVSRTQMEIDCHDTGKPVVGSCLRFFRKTFKWLLGACCPILLFLGIAGCVPYPGRLPIDSGLEPETFEGRSKGILEVGKSRDDVIEYLGEPWISDTLHRVDVFRTSERQHAIIAFLFVYVPIVFPDTPVDFKGYSLVSYDTDGKVEATDWAFVVNKLHESGQNKNVALAGDYVFDAPIISPGHTRLWVTHSRYRLDLVRDTEAATNCTLIPVCKQNDALCWDRVSVDNKDLGYVALVEQKGLVPTAEFMGPYSVPVRLLPGHHRLIFESKLYKGRVETSFTCGAGEVWYATFQSKIRYQYTFMQQFMHLPLLGEATGIAELTQEPTPDELPSMLLLFFRGQPTDGKGIALSY